MKRMLLNFIEFYLRRHNKERRITHTYRVSIKVKLM